MKSEFHLRSAVNNNDLVYASQQSINDNPEENDFVGELINYAILVAPARDITTGSSIKYTLQLNVKGNGVFWGNPKDAIANNLFRVDRSKASPLPVMLTGVQQNPDLITPKVGSLWEGAKHLLSKAWENRAALMPIASSVAALFEPEDREDTQPEVVRADYLDKLSKSLSSIGDLSVMDPTL